MERRHERCALARVSKPSVQRGKLECLPLIAPDRPDFLGGSLGRRVKNTNQGGCQITKAACAGVDRMPRLGSDLQATCTEVRK